MIIKHISIENFQSYYNSETLEFSEGLNLIVGNGGKGKSKLFNSFYWVLFGKIYITGVGWCSTDTLPNSAKFSMHKHEFINKKALFETEEEEKVRTSVVLELENDKGMIYQIERSVSALRLPNGNWDSPDAWEVSSNILKVSFDSVNGTQVKTDILAEDVINELFPVGIRNYIWFQGESLENLINFRDKKTLQAAVKHISYYPFYEKLSKIIEASQKKIEDKERKELRKVNKQNTAVNNLLTDIETNARKIDREEKNELTLENNIDMIKVALADGETKMKGLASFSSLIDKYKACENEISIINLELSSIDKFQREKLPSLWVLRGIEPLVEKCKHIIDFHKEEECSAPEKKYLDNPGRTKLEEIISDKKCFVCGSDVTEGNDAYDWIKQRLKDQEQYLQDMEDYKNNIQFNKQFNMFIGKIEDYPESLSVSLGSIDKQFTDSEDKVEALLAKRRKKIDDKQKLDEEIEKLKKKYGVDPVKQAQSANQVDSGIRASRSILEREQRKLDTCKQALATYRAEQKAAKIALEKLGAKGGSITKVPETEWKNISAFLKDICKNVEEKARKELLQKLQVRANTFYNKFTEHDNGYKGDVVIGDDYSIAFDAGLNTSHEDRKKMSVINALLSLNQEAIGTYYPFISDAPTSSFDIETTHKYLLGIKDIFGQSIIMTKDVDIESEMYHELICQSNVARIYHLESNIHEDNGDPNLHEVSTKVKQLK